MPQLVEANGVFKSYDGAAQPVEVLRGIDFSMAEGELIGVYGASGAGKSTLLHVLGGLDEPDEGDVRLMGRGLTGMTDADLAKTRNESVGFVFQFYHLLGEFSALENVMLPCLIAGGRKAEARKRAREALDHMGLLHRAAHRPAELSGGEQQRVAIARAAVMRPKVILADEPTGNLDRATGERVWEYLLQLNSDSGMGMIVVSHNHDLLGQIETLIELKDGKLSSIGG
jgi:lipoprotein-releasing system ATP-binding protein